MLVMDGSHEKSALKMVTDMNSRMKKRKATLNSMLLVQTKEYWKISNLKRIRRESAPIVNFLKRIEKITEL